MGVYYPSVGVANEKRHLFFEECKEQGDRKQEALEKLSVRFITAEEIEDAYKAGKSNVD